MTNFDPRNWLPFRPARKPYPMDLYVELEIHPDEDPDEVPCAARPIGPDEAWIMHFAVYYATGDYEHAKQHADLIVKPAESGSSRRLWTSRVRRFADDKILYQAGMAAREAATNAA